MSRLKWVVLGLSVAHSSCAVSLCDQDPTDPRCVTDQTPSETLTVMPSRLPRQGAQLTVRLGQGPGVVTLRQNGKQVSLGSLGDGVLQINVTQAMLDQGPISLGTAQVVVARTGKADAVMPISIFAEPQFGALLTFDTQPAGETPEGLAIKPAGGFLAFQSFPRATGTGRSQHFVDYQITSDQIQLIGPAFANYSIAPWADRPARAVFLSKTNRAIAFGRDLYGNADAIQTDSCSLSPEICTTLAGQLDFQKVMGLAVDPKGTVLAVQSDAELFVYQTGDPLLLANRLAITGGQTARADQKAALGDLNGDKQIDLVTFAAGEPFVFLGQSSGAFQFDATWSSKLKTALPSVPTAVASADLDGDGNDDLVMASGSSVQVLFAQPEGAFVVSPALPGMNAVDQIAIGPVDGKTGSAPDIAISSQTGQKLGAIINQTTF